VARERLGIATDEREALPMNVNTRQLVRRPAPEPARGAPAYPSAAGHARLSWTDLLALALLAGLAFARCVRADEFRPVPLHQAAGGVQPMTGIVMWASSKHCQSDAIQLEYSYMRYDDVVRDKGAYDWSAVERKLQAIAGRKHQAVLRFYDTWPGRTTTVPSYIKALPDYHETQAPSEGRPTSFPDWSNAEYQRFILEFYEKFAQKYDRDPRLAFLETGFGLWAEYHI
jgi:hypothetical protein